MIIVRKWLAIAIFLFMPLSEPAQAQQKGGVLGVLNNFTATTDPGASNDNTQGYSVGSRWFNTSSNGYFVAQSVGTNAAVWSPVAPSIISWTSSTIAANVTDYDVPGGLSANQNVGALSPRNGVLSNFYARVAVAPGAGQTVTYTLYVGTPAAMSATSVTCQISGASSTICNDTTHSATITAGQAWAVQVVTSSSASSTGQRQNGLQFVPN